MQCMCKDIICVFIILLSGKKDMDVENKIRSHWFYCHGFTIRMSITI